MLIFGRGVAGKIISDFRKFQIEISKSLKDNLGQTWCKTKKRKKWGTLSTSVTHDCWENLLWNFFYTFTMLWKVYNIKFMNGSQCFLRESAGQRICEKLLIIHSIDLRMFTGFQYSIVFPIDIVTSRIHCYILEF